ncbi:rod shape-determining protein MreD [Porticoccaceae bacterium LTM1]|nr:rod shape-determining protein MreD [Porticoccaceae bacterium LTM1]
MRRPYQSNQLGALLIALLLATVLQILPLQQQLSFWRPQFVLLVLTFFLLYRPLDYGVATAWLIGLMLDFVFGGVVGRYALALGVCAYLINLLAKRLLHAHIWHQCGVVFLLVAASQLIVASVNLLTHSNASWSIIFLPAISSALIWPLIYFLMFRWVRR